MRRQLVVIFIALSVTGCQAKARPNETVRPQPIASTTVPVENQIPHGTEAQQQKSPGEPQRFGEPLSTQPTTDLAVVLANPKAFPEPVTVEGKVRRACTRKGCWMELASATDDNQRCRVTFKDYGFFVPTDSAGASAKVQGQIVSKLITAGNVEHLEGEGAVFPNKHADGSASEVRLVATGVELVR
jgi:hypothetical protein